MIEKIKIAFDIDKTWEYETFRELIRKLWLDIDNIELYLVTKHVDVEEVNSIATLIGMNITTNVFIEVDNDALLSKIDDLDIKIYLNGEKEVVDFINDDAEDTVGILVNALPDRYNMQPMYITSLHFWIKQIGLINAQKSC